ncbi:MAG: bifunctional DNA-formamidopyrimidine glycosylase/DNA-(apurinic or apyrimidinic site) lyase [Deltaproteobacteria bacterium]|nr:MAG: bifunctional DNA-formamidopyrimidine glycosylase/DNA-(apurinic or apyrimidinic site) lyase [Deltaproteobacteria bacterium]
MPELPEVETIRRQLEPAIVGRRIERMEVLDPRWCEPAPPDEVAQAVEHRHIEKLDRRGKYLILELADDVHLVMHLRMTGNLLLVPPGDSERRYLRVRIDLDDGHHLLFADARRFGTGLVLLGADAVHDYFSGRVGIEPLGPDFTADALRGLASGRRQPVKAFLLSQERVAGVGNIYVDEALWLAKVHPLRPVGTLKRAQLEALHEAVVTVLHAGIDAKGATIDDYRDATGAEGSFQDRFEVYGREGEPCSRCGATIRKIKAAGRGTYFCPREQRAPRA